MIFELFMLRQLYSFLYRIGDSSFCINFIPTALPKIKSRHLVKKLYFDGVGIREY